MASELSSSSSLATHNLHTSSLRHSFSCQSRVAAEDIPGIDVAPHKAQIARLTAKRNAIFPIWKLPNEILSCIFAIHAVDAHFDLKWTQIMYVCSRWYSLVLAEQLLWAHINMEWNSFAIVRFFRQIERSGVAPLMIQIHLSEAASEIILFDHCPRLHALEVGGEARYIYHLIEKMSGHSFPNLASLSLDTCFKRVELPHDFIEALPDVLFDGRLPRLRALTLRDIAFPWRLVNNLETLNLTNCDNSLTSTPTTFYDLLSLIRSCPRLRNLALTSDNLPAPVPLQYYYPVDLPFLNELYLCQDISVLLGLLHFLHFPATAAICILASDVRCGAEVKDILIPLRKHMRAPTAPRISLLKIDVGGVKIWGVTRPDYGITHLALSFFSGSAPGRKDFSVSITSYPPTKAALRQIAAKVIKAAPNTSITHLDAREAVAVDTGSWCAALKLLPALHTVYLFAHAGGSNLLCALGDIRIRRLHVVFGQPVTVPHREVDDFLEALKNYMRITCAWGNELESLELEDPQNTLCKHEKTLQRLFPVMDASRTTNM
ncbi:hypothetical protein GGX14DRAFT_652249, partial [Mycena pura]